MFVGHFAVGLAAKKVAPKVSLGTLFAAGQCLDLIWPVLLIAGVERVEVEPGITVVSPLNLVEMPWSHSLLMATIWSLLFGGLYSLVRKDKVGGIVLGAVIFSHWILDAVTHRPDLALYPGSDYLVGFGLWNSLLGTLVLEVGIFVAAIWLYANATQAENRKGSIGFWSLIGFLCVMYVGSIFGPVPEIESAQMGTSSLALFIPLIGWAYWADRNRKAKTEDPS